MALRCRKFHGGRLPRIGITARPMATIGGIGLSGMKPGTKNEWTISCRAIELAFRSRRVSGGLNWKGRGHGEKLRSVLRMNWGLSFERGWSVNTYILYIFGEFVVCEITSINVTLMLCTSSQPHVTIPPDSITRNLLWHLQSITPRFIPASSPSHAQLVVFCCSQFCPRYRTWTRMFLHWYRNLFIHSHSFFFY